MSDAVRTDALHHALVSTPVLWPGEHVVLARVVNAANGQAVLAFWSTAQSWSVSLQKSFAQLGSEDWLCDVNADEVEVPNTGDQRRIVFLLLRHDCCPGVVVGVPIVD